jgi:hypothetical protein
MLNYTLHKLDNFNKRLNNQQQINRSMAACMNKQFRAGLLYSFIVGGICLTHTVYQDHLREKSMKRALENQQCEIDILKAEIEGLKEMKG